MRPLWIRHWNLISLQVYLKYAEYWYASIDQMSSCNWFETMRRTQFRWTPYALFLRKKFLIKVKRTCTRHYTFNQGRIIRHKYIWLWYYILTYLRPWFNQALIINRLKEWPCINIHWKGHCSMEFDFGGFFLSKCHIDKQKMASPVLGLPLYLNEWRTWNTFMKNKLIVNTYVH